MAPRPGTETAEALDDVFDNYMVDSDEDPFRDLDTSIAAPKASSNNKKRKNRSDDEKDGLGVDEEIKVIKKRKPVPKLDEARLLSQQGLPTLKSTFRSKLAPKLKGKGHEFSDTAKLLQFYQLWLDALYPRAKFADALSMVEKVGHSKRMQVMRKAWIDEGKRRTGNYMEDVDHEQSEERNEATRGDATRADSGENSALNRLLFGNGEAEEDSLFIPESHPHPDKDNEGPADDELDALLAENTAGSTKSKQPARDDGSEGEDDLDALLAEESARRSGQQDKPWRRLPEHDEDDDDLDALLAEHDARRTDTSIQQQPTTQVPVENEDDDLDALLAEQNAQSHQASGDPISPKPQQLSTIRFSNKDPEDEEDDLDALLAETNQSPNLTQEDLPPPPQQQLPQQSNTPTELPNLAPPTQTIPDEEDASALLPSSSPVKDPEHADLEEDDLDAIK